MPSNEMKWSDARRILAVELREQDVPIAQIEQATGAKRSTVFAWLKKAREQGVEALVRGYAKREGKLSAPQRQDLGELLDQGALAAGFPDEQWTGHRVVELIHAHFGVTYHFKSIPRLLDELGFSWQKPQTRDPRRDEDAIETWVREEWPRLQKKSSRRRRDPGLCR